MLKLDETAARAEIARMLEFYDTSATDEDKANILPAVMDGRLTYDEGSGAIEYVLAKPIELQNGTRFEAVRLREPQAADLEYINKGWMVSMDQDKRAAVDMSQMITRTIRMVIKLGGVAVGVADRIYRKDLAVLGSICNFFT